MRKLLTILFLITSCKSVLPVTSEHAPYFHNIIDDTFNCLDSFSKTNPKDSIVYYDTSKWFLYQITNVNNKLSYHYLRTIPFYYYNPCGYDDLVARFKTECLIDDKLYGWCSIKDTIIRNPIFKMMTNNCNQ